MNEGYNEGYMDVGVWDDRLLGEVTPSLIDNRLTGA